MMQNTNSKASPGQPFRPPPAEVWNGMVDAGDAFRSGRLSNGIPGPTRPRETDIVKLLNSSGADRAKGEILRIDGKAITDLSDEHLWLIGNAPTAAGYFAILKEPIAGGEVGDAQASGCCLATVNVTDVLHTRAAAGAGLYVLQSGDEGPVEILFAPGGTGSQDCVVRFGGGSGGGGGGGGDEIFAFALTGDMAAKEAPADISELNGAAIGAAVASTTIYDPQDIFFMLVTGAKGLCMRRAGVYYIIQAKCPVTA